MIYIMILLLILLIFPLPIFAQQLPDVRINEFQIEPAEAVELVSTGNEIIDVSGWYLDDNGGKSFYTIPEGTTIDPHSCLVVTGSFNLNKSSADSVRLFNSTADPATANAVVIDAHDYDKSPGADTSFQRNPDGEDTWETGTASLGKWNKDGTTCLVVPTATVTPTPPSPSSPTPQTTPTPQTSPISNISLSEVMVAPESGDKEWIELYNDNAFEVTLLSWFLDDVADGGSAPVEFSLTLPAEGYGVYELSSAIFNNSGDHIRLLNTAQEEQDIFEYTSSEKGMTWGQPSTGNVFCIQEPTKGKVNGNCVDTITKTPTPTPVPRKTGAAAPSAAPKQSTTQKQPQTVLQHYRIVITPPVMQQNVPSVQGITTVAQRSFERSRPASPFPLLASSYSLLSIISILAKMKYMHVEYEG